jgi:organic hydroperoxide reductase OsmC/OhrA
MMAAALMCSVASCEYELDARKKGALYRGIEASATMRKGADIRKRGVYKSLDVTVRVNVPEEHLAEFEGVVKEHADNGCTVTRSFNSGFKVSMNIEKV